MSKPTPGPWKVTHRNPQAPDVGYIEGGTCVEPYEIAVLYCCYGDSEQEANARLVAAAPELYEACKEFVRKVERGEARSVKSYAQMKAAISKAEEGAEG